MNSLLLQETQLNDARSYKNKKKQLTNQLVSVLELCGYAAIVLVFLQDNSILKLFIRGMLQFVIGNPFPRDVQHSMNLTKESKKALARTTLNFLCLVNFFCIIVHLLYSYKVDSEPRFSYGGLNLQIIGESYFSSLVNEKVWFVCYDLAIAALQYTLFCITFVEREDLLSEEGESLTTEGDGSDGEIKLFCINLPEIYTKVTNFNALDLDQMRNEGFTGLSFQNMV